MKKISRLISVIHRHGMRFFNCCLADTEIGRGQQFFLVCIYENPGISMQKLASIGHFDKGTVTKAVKKWRIMAILDVNRMPVIREFSIYLQPLKRNLLSK